MDIFNATKMLQSIHISLIKIRFPITKNAFLFLGIFTDIFYFINMLIFQLNVNTWQHLKVTKKTVKLNTKQQKLVENE